MALKIITFFPTTHAAWPPRGLGDLLSGLSSIGALVHLYVSVFRIQPSFKRFFSAKPPNTKISLSEISDAV